MKYTLASAFEEVAVKLEGSELSDMAIESANEAITYIKKKLKVNSTQTFILASMLHCASKNMDTDELAVFAKVSPIRIMEMQKDIDSLVDNGMIVCVKPANNNSWQQTLRLSVGVVQSVKYNKGYTPTTYNNISVLEFWDIIANLLNDCDYEDLAYAVMLKELKKIVDESPHIEFCRKLKVLDWEHAEFVLFLIAVKCLVVKGKDFVSTCDYDDIIPEVNQCQIIRMFKDKCGYLYENNLLEAIDSDCDTFRLSLKAKQDYLREFGFRVEDVDATKTIDSDKSSQDNIAEKMMFYNDQESAQIERLIMLLDKDKFEEVRERMCTAKMRPGFTCLFYGEPGTGKTETVLQIARVTGREIVYVDVAALRNCYVGESEKNIQRIFDDYRSKVETCAVTPILFLNEADAILGKRYVEINDAVDQMENTMQNIILQNLERFEGILMATTNLTRNLDKAFERRFLYKIEFHQPNVEVRKLIWLSVIPDLSNEDASMLAERYAFSGGQIENVARKQLIDSILYNNLYSLSSLQSLCDEELINKHVIGRNRKL